MLPHDELYHYGVKGMRWGVRKYGSAVGESMKLNMRHPNIMDRAFRESMAKQSTGTRLRRSMLFSKTGEIRDMNRRANRMIGEKQAAKLAKTQAKVDRSLNKKVDSRNHARHKETFERALITTGIGVTVGTGGILMKLAHPTVDVYGKRIAKRVTQPNNIFKYASKGLTKNVMGYKN